MYRRRRRLGFRRRRFFAKERLIQKKDHVVSETEKFLIGVADVSQPTRNTWSVYSYDIGFRFCGAMSAIGTLISAAPAALLDGRVNDNYGALGDTGLTGAFKHQQLCPLAVHAYWQNFEVCNLNKAPCELRVEIWRWKSNRAMSDRPMSVEYRRGREAGTGGMVAFLKTPEIVSPSVYTSTVRNNTNIYDNIGNGKEISSYFGDPKRIWDRSHIWRQSSKKILVPPSSVFRFRVFFPRMWPVYSVDLNIDAAKWMSQYAQEKLVVFKWRSLCGLIPTGNVSDDPTDASINSEKQILAIRWTRSIGFTRYSYEPPIQAIVNPAVEVTALDARTAVNRATHFQPHTDAEFVAGVPGQAPV